MDDVLPQGCTSPEPGATVRLHVNGGGRNARYPLRAPATGTPLRCPARQPRRGWLPGVSRTVCSIPQEVHTGPPDSAASDCSRIDRPRALRDGVCGEPQAAVHHALPVTRWRILAPATAPRSTRADTAMGDRMRPVMISPPRASLRR